MEPKPRVKALKSFNPAVMLETIDHLRGIIQRIRQKEGGIGSDEDELAIHRAIQDLDILVDISDGLKSSHAELVKKLEQIVPTVTLLQNQQKGLKETYEKMLHTREDRIKELQTEVAKLSKPKRKTKKTKE